MVEILEEISCSCEVSFTWKMHPAVSVHSVLYEEWSIQKKLYIRMYVVGSKSFRPDQLFKMTEIKQLCYFSTQSPFVSTHFSTDTLTSPQMALHTPHSIFHLARLLYVRPVTFGPYYVRLCGQHIQLRSVSGSMAGFCDFFFPRLLLVFDGHFFLISSAESLTWSLLQWQKSLQNKYTSGKYISRISCMQGEDTWLAESDFSVTSTQKKLL